MKADEPRARSDELAASDIERLYRAFRLIRSLEEEVARIYPSDKIKSPVHLSIGQEAISVGVCDALEDDDVVAGSYRGHALYLAKGGDPGAMMAEMYGKVTGCARGKGGSMHLVGMDHNILGASAVVGTTIPVAVGYALALARGNERRVAASFFGDGATEEGCFYESLNFAALRKLPILFVCENNGLAIHTPLAKRWAAPDLCARVAGFGVPTHLVEASDIFQIRAAAAEAIGRIRNGGGPEFIECQTYRWREHVGPNEDYDDDYRSYDEARPWIETDQLPRLAEMLNDAQRAAIDEGIATTIANAVAFAEQSPFPEPEELFAHVFAD